MPDRIENPPVADMSVEAPPPDAGDWGLVREAELTAFSAIVTRIYANQPVLS